MILVSTYILFHVIAILQKIRELISVLDQRKDESIERTFKGVARHFREVFSELVQGGHGYLVMMKKKVCLFLKLFSYILYMESSFSKAQFVFLKFQHIFCVYMHAVICYVSIC